MAGGKAGMAGNVFMYRALAATGVRDPFDQQMLMAGGIFGNPGDYGGRSGSVLDAEISELRRETAGMPKNRMYLGFSHLTGLNPIQSKHFLENYETISGGRLGGFRERLKSLGIDASHLTDGSGLADLSDVILAKPEELDAIRKRVLAGRSGLSAEEKDALQHASLFSHRVSVAAVS